MDSRMVKLWHSRNPFLVHQILNPLIELVQLFEASQPIANSAISLDL
jgi:hypothetical protein